MVEGGTGVTDQWGNPSHITYRNGWSTVTERNPMFGRNPNQGSQTSTTTAAAPQTPSVMADFSSFMSKFGPKNQTNRFESALSSSQGRIDSLLDNPDSINQSAAYKFRVNQGQEALNRNLAAKGMLGSGNRLMELTKYGQDMASQEYDNQFNRLANLYQTNASSWIGDKNANTNQFAATGNLYSSMVGNQNQAQSIANQYALGSEQNSLRRMQLDQQSRGWGF